MFILRILLSFLAISLILPSLAGGASNIAPYEGYEDMGRLPYFIRRLIGFDDRFIRPTRGPTLISSPTDVRSFDSTATSSSTMSPTKTSRSKYVIQFKPRETGLEWEIDRWISSHERLFNPETCKLVLAYSEEDCSLIHEESIEFIQHLKDHKSSLLTYAARCLHKDVGPTRESFWHTLNYHLVRHFFDYLKAGQIDYIHNVSQHVVAILMTTALPHVPCATTAAGAGAYIERIS